MKPATYRTVGAACAIVGATLALGSVVFGAAMKLSRVETLVEDTRVRVCRIENILQGVINGRTPSETARRSRGAQGLAVAERPDPEQRVLRLGEIVGLGDQTVLPVDGAKTQ